MEESEKDLLPSALAAGWKKQKRIYCRQLQLTDGKGRFTRGFSPIDRK